MFQPTVIQGACAGENTHHPSTATCIIWYGGKNSFLLSRLSTCVWPFLTANWGQVETKHLILELYRPKESEPRPHNCSAIVVIATITPDLSAKVLPPTNVLTDLLFIIPLPCR